MRKSRKVAQLIHRRPFIEADSLTGGPIPAKCDTEYTLQYLNMESMTQDSEEASTSNPSLTATKKPTTKSTPALTALQVSSPISRIDESATKSSGGGNLPAPTGLLEYDQTELQLGRPLTPATYEVLDPPENFIMVSAHVYRSSMPKRRNFPFLAKLGLKSVL